MVTKRSAIVAETSMRAKVKVKKARAAASGYTTERNREKRKWAATEYSYARAQ